MLRLEKSRRSCGALETPTAANLRARLGEPDRAGRRRLLVLDADCTKWLADHLRFVVAENRRGPRIPYSDQMILVRTNETIAQRHCNALKTIFGNSPEQTAEI